jgi:hypothetical protein
MGNRPRETSLRHFNRSQPEMGHGKARLESNRATEGDRRLAILPPDKGDNAAEAFRAGAFRMLRGELARELQGARWVPSLRGGGYLRHQRILQRRIGLIDRPRDRWLHQLFRRR